MSIEGKLQPLLHVIISFSLWNPVSVWNVAGPKAERKELWRSAFFFFFLTQKAWGGFYLFCVFFVGELFWLHPEAFVVFVRPGFRLTLPALEARSQPSNQQRSLWRVLNFCSFLATANYMAHPAWDRGQKMQWEWGQYKSTIAPKVGRTRMSGEKHLVSGWGSLPLPEQELLSLYLL